MNKTQHPTLSSLVEQEDVDYNCPECSDRLFTDMDMVVKDGKPAIIIRLECHTRSKARVNGDIEDSECSFVTSGIIKTE